MGKRDRDYAVIQEIHSNYGASLAGKAQTFERWNIGNHERWATPADTSDLQAGKPVLMNVPYIAVSFDDYGPLAQARCVAIDTGLPGGVPIDACLNSHADHRCYCDD